MTRTPAVQAGLASNKLTFRDIFVARIAPPRLVLERSRAEAYHGSMEIKKWAA